MASCCVVYLVFSKPRPDFAWQMLELVMALYSSTFTESCSALYLVLV
jgi:hypothetical protein